MRASTSGSVRVSISSSCADAYQDAPLLRRQNRLSFIIAGVHTGADLLRNQTPVAVNRDSSHADSGSGDSRPPASQSGVGRDQGANPGKRLQVISLYRRSRRTPFVNSD
jgi:hypothetical protein